MARYHLGMNSTYGIAMVPDDPLNVFHERIEADLLTRGVAPFAAYIRARTMVGTAIDGINANLIGAHRRKGHIPDVRVCPLYGSTIGRIALTDW